MSEAEEGIKIAEVLITPTPTVCDLCGSLTRLVITCKGDDTMEVSDGPSDGDEYAFVVCRDHFQGWFDNFVPLAVARIDLTID